MNSDRDSARRYFEKYGGSHFFMAHDDEDAYTRYKQCHISPQTENAWRLQMLDAVLADIAQNRWHSMRQYRQLYIRYCIIASAAGDAPRLKRLCSLFFRDFAALDTLTQLVCAENLLPLFGCIKTNVFLTRKLCGRIFDLLKSAFEKDLHINEDFPAGGTTPAYLTEDALRGRMAKLLSAYKTEMRQSVLSRRVCPRILRFCKRRR